MNTIDVNHFTRIKNDGNGNPRYIIAACRVSNDVKRRMGFKKYRGGGAGLCYVIQSYNIAHTALLCN